MTNFSVNTIKVREVANARNSPKLQHEKLRKWIRRERKMHIHRARLHPSTPRPKEKRNNSCCVYSICRGPSTDNTHMHIQAPIRINCKEAETRDFPAPQFGMLYAQSIFWFERIRYTWSMLGLVRTHRATTHTTTLPSKSIIYLSILKISCTPRVNSVNTHSRFSVRIRA